jgi:hypothetical protein
MESTVDQLMDVSTMAATCADIGSDPSPLRWATLIRFHEFQVVVVPSKGLTRYVRSTALSGNAIRHSK